LRLCWILPYHGLLVENIMKIIKCANSKLVVELFVLIIFSFFFVFASTLVQGEEVKHNQLTAEEEQVIVHKGTERPFTGKYNNFTKSGTYTCKRCAAQLYDSKDKIATNCGWPGFDDEISGAVKRIPDADGRRTEILCNSCGAHLGHVFLGEGYTAKNTRHCVNSISLDFIPAGEKEDKNTEKAYFAGGCFWGVELLFQKEKGVVSTRVGYMGGSTKDPSYKQVSYENTGHAEAIEVVYDTNLTRFDKMARFFFEIHDPSQLNSQGPDIGDQYRSVVFYVNDKQKEISGKLIKILKGKGYQVVTEVVPAGTFWQAEDYHQDYYKKSGKQPYCHFYQKKF